MTKRMLIDAAHAEETRVVVVDGTRIEELDFESASRKQLRGNIYLAKVTRVEPSLQAAFVEYGGNRHGFLAFNEIHPDYYQIPMADREALMREVEADHHDDDEHDDADRGDDETDDEGEEAFQRRQRRLMRRYKIQEVIRRRQIMLVQVVKEERGNKGAALTTYLSLAGRYGVLMPNTARGGGISRKITSATDRRRLKSVVQGFDVPHGMGLIVRTAGAKRTKAEIARDYDYLLRLWENIRETTLKSVAPALIYEEEDLVKRAIRDMYDKDLDGILVEGEAGYREARDFMRMIMPGQAGKIRPYRETTPLFVAHRIEDQIAQIHSPVVPLKSGGYLVINQTEALVAIDVNSGKATREKNIEATAFKTNLEAAEEAARQLRLRDLAGLIVIDFIDMDEGKNNRAVEKVLKDCLADDRARIQMGKISAFGLMEISRQRRRMGVLEGATHVCEHCQGTGRVRSVESSALAALRAIEVEAAKGGAGALSVRLPTAVGLYVLNEKRVYLARLEQMHGLEVSIFTDGALAHADVEVERTATYDGEEGSPKPRRAPAFALAVPETLEDDEPFVADDYEDEDEEIEEDAEEAELVASPPAPQAEPGGRSRRRRRGGRRDETEVQVLDPQDGGIDDDGEEDDPNDDSEEAEHRRRRRRRGRRGGRRLREDGVRDVYAWVHPHGGYDTPHPKDDPYAWKDPHAPHGRIEAWGAQPEKPAPVAPPAAPPAPAVADPNDPYVWLDPEAASDQGERGARSRDRGRNRRSRGGRSRGRDRNESEAPLTTPESAPQDAPPPAGAAPTAVEAPVVMEAVAPTEMASPAADGIEQPETIPAVTAAASPPDVAPPESDAPPQAQAQPELQPEPELQAPPEPDPNEITGKPAAPRRGWWRRLG